MIGERDAWQIRIHPLVKVLVAEEEVGDGVRSPCNMFKHIIEILKEFDPAGLAARHLLWFAEILEVLVVRQDSNRMSGTKEEGAATLEPKDNARQFTVVDVVVSFRWEETAGVEHYRMHTVGVFLRNDHT